MLGFAVVVRLEPFPLEPDLEVGIRAAPARHLPAETDTEAVTAFVAVAHAPPALHVQAEHQPRLLRLRKAPQPSTVSRVPSDSRRPTPGVPV